MLGRGLWTLLKLLAFAGSVATLLADSVEDWNVPAASLQEECSSKCPDLDLNQVPRNNLVIFVNDLSEWTEERISNDARA
ncbi:hypothetical protein KPH14_011169 [Odynerus spinipes]|uniref:Uncharacterized protein n=1 Tax=Odynerus spinipes TaxID=1348599 RepID=A0AAD9RFU8_9HYME|nr:hypothetical protein KPH14_011169 [Odynerus spinipes]